MKAEVWSDVPSSKAVDPDDPLRLLGWRLGRLNLLEFNKEGGRMSEIKEQITQPEADGAASVEKADVEEFDFLYYNGPISSQLTAFIRKKTTKAKHKEVRLSHP